MYLNPMGELSSLFDSNRMPVWSEADNQVQNPPKNTGYSTAVCRLYNIFDHTRSVGLKFITSRICYKYWVSREFLVIFHYALL